MYSKDFKNLALKLYQNLKSFRKVIKGKNTTTETKSVSVFYEALSWLKL